MPRQPICNYCGKCQSCRNRRSKQNKAAGFQVAPPPLRIYPDDVFLVQHGMIKLCNICDMPGYQHISWRHCIASLKAEIDKMRWKLGSAA